MRRAAALLAALLGAACPPSDPAALPVPPLTFGIEDPWPERTPYPGVGEGRVLVTNTQDDTVSVFDLAQLREPTLAELARVPVGLSPVQLEGPHHAAVDPSGERYFVGISNAVAGAGSGPHGAHGTGTADGYVLEFRAHDNRLVGSLRVDRSPGDLRLSADGSTLFVTHFDLLKISEVLRRGGPPAEMDSRLAILDARTLTKKAMVPLCPAAHGIGLSPDGRRLYATCQSDELAVVALDDPSWRVQRVKVAPNAGTADRPVHQPYALAVNPRSGEVWVSCLAGRDLHVLDPLSLEVDPARTRAMPGVPMVGAISDDGATLLLPLQGAEVLTELDAATGQRRRDLPLSGCVNVHQVDFAPGGRTALVVCEGSHVGPGALQVLDWPSGGWLKTVPVGVFPDFVGVLRRRP